MAEYIERNKGLELIRNFKRDDVTEHCADYAAGWNEALEQIECNVKEDIPAADVRPERHGYWNDSFDGITPVCSVCGMAHHNFKRCPDYCPNCGAKMDREEDENNG